MPSQKTSTTITKTPNDVLCGRGGLSNNHPGNHVFRRIVNQNKESYQAREKPSHKHFVVVSIIGAIRRNGGRFIEQKRGVWQEIPIKKAMTKTSQALREQQEYTATEDSSSSKSKSSMAIADSKSKSNPLYALAKPLDGSASSQPTSSTTAQEEQQQQGGVSNTTKKSAQQQMMIPATVTSHKRTPPAEACFEKCMPQDEYSAAVIECEIEQALEELLDDDDFAFQKEYSPVVAESPCLSSSFQVQSRTFPEMQSPAMICSDSEEEGDDEEYDLCPLGITENLVNTFEYAEMCTDLVNSLSSC
jgi:hypothetical protein